MKFAVKNKSIKIGTFRKIKKFAWLPVHVKGYWIWLEYYEVMYQWDKKHHKDSNVESYGFYKNTWIEIEKDLVK